jgi:ABC-type siderophore export system fused ATPase/permease subunit
MKGHIIFGIGIVIIVIITISIMATIYNGYPHSSEETFKNDASIVEYCYIVDDVKDMPVSNGRETRMVSTTLMQKVCVDRNLSVISSVPFDNSHNEAFMYWHKKEV